MTQQLVLPQRYLDLRKERPRNDAPFKIGGCTWTDNNGGTRFYEGARKDSPAATVDKIERITSVNEALKRKQPLLEKAGIVLKGIEGIEMHYPNEVDESTFGDIMKKLKAKSMVASMMTPNLFYTFRQGALMSTNPEDRARALEWAKKTVDLIYKARDELGHKPMNVYWPGGEGWQVPFEIDPVLALHLHADGMDQIMDYDVEKHEGILEVAGESKPNEPKSHIIIPTTADFLAIMMMMKPEYRARFGFNPETAHEMLANLSPVNPVALALALGKLFHYHGNWQNGLKWDEDHGVPVNLSMLWVVHLMKEYGFNGFIGLDIQSRPESKDITAVIENSVVNLRLLEALEKKVDWAHVQKLRDNGEMERIQQYVQLCTLQLLPQGVDAKLLV